MSSLVLRAALLRSSGLGPTWAHSFLNGAIPSGSAFTRASSGWSFNSAGTLVSASSNVARFDYDPATLSPLGYLAEMQSTNAVTQSQDLSNVYWSGGQNVTRTANAVTSPDGTANASTITEDGTTNRHECDMLNSISVSAASVYGVSFFVKNVSGSRWIVVSPGGGANYFGFQPSTGTLSGVTGTLFSGASVRTLANGWYRVSFSVTPTGTSTTLYFSMQTASPSGSTQSYAGDGTSAVSIWGVQLETAGVGITSYISTAGSTVTRSQDILSLPLTSLPGWNASKGGVLVAAYRLHTNVPSSPGNNQGILRLDDGTANNEVVIDAAFNSTTPITTMRSGNVTQANPNAGAPPAPFTRRKVAGGWGVSRVVMAVDGAVVAGTSGSFALPVSPTTLNIGTDSSQQLNGTLESIAYYAGQRSDAFVQAVSR